MKSCSLGCKRMRRMVMVEEEEEAKPTCCCVDCVLYSSNFKLRRKEKNSAPKSIIFDTIAFAPYPVRNSIFDFPPLRT